MSASTYPIVRYTYDQAAAGYLMGWSDPDIAILICPPCDVQWDAHSEVGPDCWCCSAPGFRPVVGR